LLVKTRIVSTLGVLVCPVCGFAKREKDAEGRLPVFLRMR
jgi:hypothetical protein